MPSNDLLGEREGHCAATLTCSGGGSIVFVVGGFLEGELSPRVICSPLQEACLEWAVAAEDEAAFAKDGASLTAVAAFDMRVEADSSSCVDISAERLILFGGMRGNARKTNDCLLIRALWDESKIAGEACCASTKGTDKETSSLRSVARVHWTSVRLSGDVPPPVFRHAAACTGESLFVFGGATELLEQVNDMFEVNLQTFLSRSVHLVGSPLRPRFLACVVYAPKQARIVVFGGAYFTDRGEQRSCADLAIIALTRANGWHYAVNQSVGNVEHLGDVACGDAVINRQPEGCSFLPRCNGHVGCCFGCFGAGSFSGEEEVVVFSGGKDFAEGCDDVVMVNVSSGAAVMRSIAGGPHWRYTASAVALADRMWILAGQCRHPDEHGVYLLSIDLNSAA